MEASARVVKFPGVSCFAFRELLLYLYTDRAPSPRLSPSNCLSVIELANRLCLPESENFLGKFLRPSPGKFKPLCGDKHILIGIILQRLISLIEVAVVAKMEKDSDSRNNGQETSALEVMEDALKIIESCQVSVKLIFSSLNGQK